MAKKFTEQVFVTVGTHFRKLWLNSSVKRNEDTYIAGALYIQHNNTQEI